MEDIIIAASELEEDLTIVIEKLGKIQDRAFDIAMPMRGADGSILIDMTTSPSHPLEPALLDVCLWGDTSRKMAGLLSKMCETTIWIKHNPDGAKQMSRSQIQTHTGNSCYFMPEKEPEYEIPEPSNTNNNNNTRRGNA